MCIVTGLEMGYPARWHGLGGPYFLLRRPVRAKRSFLTKIFYILKKRKNSGFIELKPAFENPFKNMASHRLPLHEEGFK